MEHQKTSRHGAGRPDGIQKPDASQITADSKERADAAGAGAAQSTKLTERQSATHLWSDIEADPNDPESFLRSMASKVENNLDYLDHFGQYEPLRVGEFVPSKVVSFVTCMLCMNVLRGPTVCPCGHAFCRLCFKSAISETGKCPYGGEALSEDELQLDRDLALFIGNLDVYCCVRSQFTELPKHEIIDVVRKCSWSGPLYRRHLHDCSHYPQPREAQRDMLMQALEVDADDLDESMLDEAERRRRQKLQRLQKKLDEKDKEARAMQQQAPAEDTRNVDELLHFIGAESADDAQNKLSKSAKQKLKKKKQKERQRREKCIEEEQKTPSSVDASEQTLPPLRVEAAQPQPEPQPESEPEPMPESNPDAPTHTHANEDTASGADKDGGWEIAGVKQQRTAPVDTVRSRSKTAKSGFAAAARARQRAAPRVGNTPIPGHASLSPLKRTPGAKRRLPLTHRSTTSASTPNQQTAPPAAQALHVEANHTTASIPADARLTGSVESDGSVRIPASELSALRMLCEQLVDRVLRAEQRADMADQSRLMLEQRMHAAEMQVSSLIAIVHSLQMEQQLASFQTHPPIDLALDLATQQGLTSAPAQGMDSGLEEHEQRQRWDAHS